MQKAGVENADALLDSRASNQTALSRSILDLVRETQDKFTIRSGKVERWDVKTSAWMKEPAQEGQILSALETLNMMDAVPPAFKKREMICVLGASRSVMVSRLDYAGELFRSISFQFLCCAILAQFIRWQDNRAAGILL